MAKKKYRSQAPLLTRIWRGSKPFRGPLFSLVGIVLFVTNTTTTQVAGVTCMLIGGLLIGNWYRERQQQRDAAKRIQHKLEKKEARKASRAPLSADDEEEEDDEDS